MKTDKERIMELNRILTDKDRLAAFHEATINEQAKNIETLMINLEKADKLIETIANKDIEAIEEKIRILEQRKTQELDSIEFGTSKTGKIKCYFDASKSAEQIVRRVDATILGLDHAKMRMPAPESKPTKKLGELAFNDKKTRV